MSRLSRALIGLFLAFGLLPDFAHAQDLVRGADVELHVERSVGRLAQRAREHLVGELVPSVLEHLARLHEKAADRRSEA